MSALFMRQFEWLPGFHRMFADEHVVGAAALSDQPDIPCVLKDEVKTSLGPVGWDASWPRSCGRPRRGFRRLHVLLRREGWIVNHKRVYRPALQPSKLLTKQ